MPRKLFVLRHGEADTDRKWKDIERPLTASGRQMILRVGQRLKSKDKIDLILSSAAKRTKETSLVITPVLGYETGSRFNPGIYNASLSVVIKTLEKIESNYQSVLLIGHNPSLSYLTDYLSGRDHYALNPGQLIEFDLFINSWDEICKGCGIIIEE